MSSQFKCSFPYSEAYTEIPLLGFIFARGWEGEDAVEAAPAQWGPSDPGAVHGAAVTQMGPRAGLRALDIYVI